MGHLWVPDADDWMRAADIVVREYSPSNPAFWLSNSRGSGGFDDIFGTVVHHDAIPAGFNEPRRVEMEAEDHIYAPVGNGHVRYDGSFDLVAAGAANTQGKGGPYRCSRGTVPLDQGNRFMWATEASNNGVGEVWTPQQVELYPRIHAAFLHGLATKGAYDAYNRRYRQIVLNPLSDVIAHLEWTSRKIDPAGPPGPDDGYANMADRYMRWFMDRFRASVAWHLADIAGAPNPVPPPSGGVMEVKVGTLVLPVGDGNRMYDSRPNQPAWHAPGVAKTKLRAGEVRKVPVVFGRAAQVRITIVQAEGPCHVIAQGEPPAADAKPFVNDFDGSGAAEKGWLGLPDGHVYLRLVGAPCHVVVDEVGAATDVTLEG